MRIILFTGTGGTGVSTMAAATAVAIAAAGQRTLAYGIGRGLGTAFDVSLTGQPKTMTDRLTAAEVRYRPDAPDTLRDWLRDLLDWRGMEADLADDFAALPGLGTVGRLLDMEDQTRDGELDVMVVDGLPLHQLLDLVAALDAAARWLDRMFPERQPTVFEPFLRVLTPYAPSGEEVYEQGRDLLLRLANLRDLLIDPEVATVRAVLSPRQAAVADIQEAVSTLGLFAYTADAVVVNGQLPPEVTDSFFEYARSADSDVLSRITDSVFPIPVLSAHLLKRPPCGIDALLDLADIYGSDDPAGVLHRGRAHAFRQRDGHHYLELVLPQAKLEDLHLEQLEDALAVQAGGWQRIIPLPREVHGLEALSSSFDGTTLKVAFGTDTPADEEK
jgi:arsenite-transporting ATPase